MNKQQQHPLLIQSFFVSHASSSGEGNVQESRGDWALKYTLELLLKMTEPPVNAYSPGALLGAWARPAPTPNKLLAPCKSRIFFKIANCSTTTQ